MKYLFLIVFLLPAPVLTISCTTTSERQVFQTFQVTDNLVDQALEILGERNRQGRLTADQYDEAHQAYSEYQRAMVFAIEIAGHDWEKATSQEILDLATRFINLVESFE